MVLLLAWAFYVRKIVVLLLLVDVSMLSLKDIYFLAGVTVYRSSSPSRQRKRQEGRSRSSSSTCSSSFNRPVQSMRAVSWTWYAYGVDYPVDLPM